MRSSTPGKRAEIDEAQRDKSRPKNMERGWVVSKHETHPVSVQRGTKDVPGSKTKDQLVLSKVSSIKNKNTTPQKNKTKQKQQ